MPANKALSQGLKILVSAVQFRPRTPQIPLNPRSAPSTEWCRVLRSPVQIGTLALALAACSVFEADCPGWERQHFFNPTPGACMRLELAQGTGALALGEACPGDAQCLIVPDGEWGHSYADETVPAVYAEPMRVGWTEAPLDADGSCPLTCD